MIEWILSWIKAYPISSGIEEKNINNLTLKECYDAMELLLENEFLKYVIINTYLEKGFPNASKNKYEYKLTEKINKILKEQQ